MTFIKTIFKRYYIDIFKRSEINVVERIENFLRRINAKRSRYAHQLFQESNQIWLPRIKQNLLVTIFGRLK